MVVGPNPTLPIMNLLRDLVLVSELQDPETVYAPDGTVAFFWPETEHSESCVGTVMAVGPKVRNYHAGALVVFHPHDGSNAIPNHRLLKERHVVGEMVGEEFIPAPDLVVVLPDWSDTEKQGSLYIPKETIPDNPRLLATVLRVGRHVSTVKAGQKVVIPPGLHGFEIGWKNRVVYAIPEPEILAIVEE